MSGTSKTSKIKKFGTGLDIRALICFLAVFAIATTGLTRYRIDHHAEKSLSEGVIISSNPKNDTEDETPDERLSVDMVPIVVDEESPFYNAFLAQDRVNVLVLGLNEGLTDTIMLGSYDMEKQTVDIVTIPRDTYYARKGIKAASLFKINSIYYSTGNSVARVAEAVSDILYGMPIHYYALVDFEDVRKVMEVIGGVEVEIPFHMKYIDTTPGHELKIDIPAGLQTIDAKNVVEFLRFRKSNYSGYKSYSEGDVQRSAVQREFIVKVMQKCLKAGNIPKIAKVVLDNVESDLSWGIAAKVATKAGGISADNIATFIIPGEGRTRTDLDSLSFYMRDEKGIEDLVKAIYRLQDPEEESSSPAAVTQ